MKTPPVPCERYLQLGRGLVFFCQAVPNPVVWMLWKTLSSLHPGTNAGATDCQAGSGTATVWLSSLRKGSSTKNIMVALVPRTAILTWRPWSNKSLKSRTPAPVLRRVPGVHEKYVRASTFALNTERHWHPPRFIPEFEVRNSNCIIYCKAFPTNTQKLILLFASVPYKRCFLNLFLPVLGLCVPFTTSFSRNGRMWTTRKSRELAISDAERSVLCAIWKLLQFPSSLIVQVILAIFTRAHELLAVRPRWRGVQFCFCFVVLSRARTKEDACVQVQGTVTSPPHPKPHTRRSIDPLLVCHFPRAPVPFVLRGRAGSPSRKCGVYFLFELEEWAYY